MSKKIKQKSPTPYTDVNEYIGVNGEIIKWFNFDYVYNKLKIKPKLLCTLDIRSGVIGIGELLYKVYHVKKGFYHIYYLDGTLIAIHESDKLDNQTYHLTKDRIECDVGMFAFHDHQYIIPERITKKYNITIVNQIYADARELLRSAIDKKGYNILLPFGLIKNENRIKFYELFYSKMDKIRKQFASKTETI